jgi:hypothetical protein
MASCWSADRTCVYVLAGDGDLGVFQSLHDDPERHALGEAQGRTGVAQVAALRSSPDLAPKAQVMALQHAAHGHAISGDRSEVDRLLDQMRASH